MAVLTVRDVVKDFPPVSKGKQAVRALDGLDFEVSGQEFVSLVGPSGCGKSTLLNIVSGIERPTTGTVDVTGDAGGRAELAYVFQDSRLLPWRTVMDNLLYVHRSKTEEVRERMLDWLDLVGLRGSEDMFPAHLSGGMQQRVGIARAFSVEPDLLLMDEPFSHLDAITARTLRDELQSIWRTSRRTVLFVTHDVLEAVQLSNRVIIMENGKKWSETVIDLPYPRHQTDVDVARTQAEILEMFEEMESRRRESAGLDRERSTGEMGASG